MMDQIESFRGVEKTKISCLKQNSFKIVTLLYFHIRSCIEFYNDSPFKAETFYPFCKMRIGSQPSCNFQKSTIQFIIALQ